MIRASEAWDFSWMAAAVQSVETYEAALKTAEFPSLILAALVELLQAPEANALQLQELSDVLLQMIAFPIDLELPRDTLTTLHSSRDWAIQTLLGIQVAQSRDLDGDVLPHPTMSKSLQQMQNKLFVSAPYRQVNAQMELLQSLLGALQAEEETDTLSDVLEMCSDSLESDDLFLQFTEAALSGKTNAMTFGSAFLQRLFDRRSIQLQADVRKTRRLFDALTLESKVRVWANHLPSWCSHLQTWMLQAHRAPFKPVSAVLPDGLWLACESRADPVAVTADCRRYSHLYVTFVEWCRDHVDLLSSCRSMELVSVISQSARQADAARLFHRELLSQIPLGDWPQNQRERAFVKLASTLERLQATRNTSDVVWQYEWIGVLERPHLLHEAQELAFNGNNSLEGEQGLSTVRSSAQFLGWFYSFSNSESADEISTLITTIASELKVSDFRRGVQWLRRSRADFGTLPILRLRLVWFWLLKSIEIALQTSENHATAATTEVLESVEYVFRRFTPPRAKRAFQVELVAHLLVELEWRISNTNVNVKERFLNALEPLCAWLLKIVRLMQLEEHFAQQKDSRNRYSNRRSPANDMQQLTERIEQFSH